jgi:hypothetical protein
MARGRFYMREDAQAAVGDEKDYQFNPEHPTGHIVNHLL